MIQKPGIDVSYAQGNINFEKIKKSQVSFAILRSSYGWMEGQKDSTFERNYNGFCKLGIPCGAYHYSYAQSKEDAIKEAEYCLKCIKGKSFALPVFIDLEDDSVARCGKRVCTDIAKAFCDYMKQHGYTAGIYINPNWLKNYVYAEELLEHYPIWLAQWNTAEPSYPCMMWQYRVGGNGSVAGIAGECDLDLFYGELPALRPAPSGTQPEKHKNQVFHVGDEVKVLDPINYDNGEKFIVYPNEKYTVIEAVGNRIVIGIDGNVTAAVNAKYLKKVKPGTDPAPHKEKMITYVIQPGDTLSGIAEHFHTTVVRLAEINHIADPDLIYGGDVLKIPQ